MTGSGMLIRVLILLGPDKVFRLVGWSKAAENCRTPKRGRDMERRLDASVLDCGGTPLLLDFCKHSAHSATNHHMPDKTRVLILGGGFGGLYAALQFEKRRDPRFEVTVVNRENFFLFTPMLHEI